MSQGAIRQMFQVQTGMYRPSGYGLQIPGMIDLGLPIFTVRRVESMKYDPDIRLGMAIKNAPLLTVKFKLSGRPEIVEFMTGEIERTWYYVVPRLLEALWYSRAGGEVIYKLGDDRKVHLGHFRDVYPSDISILTRGGQFAGIQISAASVLADDNNWYGNGPESMDRYRNKGKVTLFPPKSFLYVHGRRFGSWNGRSELLGAYSPWIDKWDQFSGALAIRRMWFYKNAYSGFWVQHPPGEYVTNMGSDGSPGTKIPYRDLARQLAEMIRTGGVGTVPFVNNPAKPGESIWKIEQPAINGDATGLHDYIRELRSDILHGLEIPDDILTAVSSVGGFAGRSVPAMAFFTSQQLALRALVQEVKEQIWDCLAELNFGSTEYDVQAEVDVDRLIPSGLPGANDEESNVAARADDPTKQMSVQSDAEFPNWWKSTAATFSGYATACVRFRDEKDKPILARPRIWRPVETIAA
jgi:hypothetical protein